MYYPKSQIKTSLYTSGGEYFRVDNNQEYKGYFWKNSKGQLFSGKTPQDTPTIQIYQKEPEISEDAGVPQAYSDWITSVPNGVSEKKPGLSPQINHPKPTEDNYTVGIFTRYFTKKSNQNIYYEISKEDHDKLVNQDGSIKWQLYIPIQVKWVLTGDKEQVYSSNRNTILIKERDQKLPGFQKIFRKNYLQYYRE